MRVIFIPLLLLLFALPYVALAQPSVQIRINGPDSLSACDVGTFIVLINNTYDRIENVNLTVNITDSLEYVNAVCNFTGQLRSCEPNKTSKGGILLWQIKSMGHSIYILNLALKSSEEKSANEVKLNATVTYIINNETKKESSEPKPLKILGGSLKLLLLGPKQLNVSNVGTFIVLINNTYDRIENVNLTVNITDSLQFVGAINWSRSFPSGEPSVNGGFLSWSIGDLSSGIHYMLFLLSPTPKLKGQTTITINASLNYKCGTLRRELSPWSLTVLNTTAKISKIAINNVVINDANISVTINDREYSLQRPRISAKLVNHREVLFNASTPAGFRLEQINVTIGDYVISTKENSVTVKLSDILKADSLNQGTINLCVLGYSEGARLIFSNPFNLIISNAIIDQLPLHYVIVVRNISTPNAINVTSQSFRLDLWDVHVFLLWRDMLIPGSRDVNISVASIEAISGDEIKIVKGEKTVYVFGGAITYLLVLILAVTIVVRLQRRRRFYGGEPLDLG